MTAGSSAVLKALGLQSLSVGETGSVKSAVAQGASATPHLFVFCWQCHLGWLRRNRAAEADERGCGLILQKRLVRVAWQNNS